MTILGRIYLGEHPKIPQDTVKAFHLLSEAAAKNNTSAMRSLWEMHFFGLLNSVLDSRQAAKWERLADALEFIKT
jgi:TPR repeat protein